MSSTLTLLRLLLCRKFKVLNKFIDRNFENFIDYFNVMQFLNDNKNHLSHYMQMCMDIGKYVSEPY